MFKTIIHDIFDQKSLQKIRLDLESGTRVYLEGELGAGKTTCVRHLITQLLGEDVDVTSPTYTYYQKYRDNIYHFDLYRIDTYEDLIATGCEEILDRDDVIAFVEWPNKVPLLEPDYMISIQLVQDPNLREIIITKKI